MGAAVSTAQQPLAEVDIKNEIGVLYGEEAQQAFAAAKEDDVVAWPKVQAYAEAHGLFNRKKAILFTNLKQFKIARDQIEAVYDEHFTGTVCEIAWRGKGLGDDRRQCALHGAPATTLDELYAVAEQALLKYGEVMTAACPDGAVLKLAPLKGRARAEAKARNEYAKNTAPATSWLFDVVRGSVMCATEDEIVRLYEALDEDPRVDIVRTKNRFNPPCFNGYRDILMNVAVRVEGAAGEEVLHLCELQIHHAAIKESEPMHKSHVTYEFFREYFLGNADAVEERADEAPAPVAVQEPRVVARRVALELGEQGLVEVELARVARRVARAAQVVAHRLGPVAERRAVVEDARVLEVAPRVERRAARRAGARRRDEVGEGRAGALEAAAVRELGEGEGHGQPVPGQLLVRDDQDDVRRPPPAPPPGPEPVRNVGGNGRGARGDEAAAAHMHRMRRDRC
jgi:hypothetical protein